MTTTGETSAISKALDGLIIFSLFLFAAAAPHSIAVTQGAWLLGGLGWILRLVVPPRQRMVRTPLDYFLLGFFILSGLTAILSYEPVVSIGKMRAASLFTIIYLVAENVRSLKVARALALTLVASCMINVFYTAATRVIGKGVKIEQVKADSPLAAATMTSAKRLPSPFPVISGDTVLTVDGNAVRSANDLALFLTSSKEHPEATVIIYRGDEFPPLHVPRGHLLPGSTPEEQLGIGSWSIGRDWRAKGFYGHYVSYAEALQLIASLAFGLFLTYPIKKNRISLFLLMAFAGLVFALMLTVTRASWLALLVSATVMLLLGTSRRVILIAFACAIPLVITAAFVLQQKRHVGLIDQQDASITWRQTVWREGFDLLKSKPRHLLIGVGMDSIKAHWREWGLFDQGRIPIGHMHSNLLEIALERGVPALLLWLALLAAYARMLFQTFRKLKVREIDNQSNWLDPWVDRGIILGALGGLCGFFVSGIVHYNWGDSEVIMIFYFLMGLSLVVARGGEDMSSKSSIRSPTKSR
ncbi:MAG TPA: O-antigen ligase family protein [Pyrinomonadaceae bacterium]|nr:O-antigen ligase family protein [Pyrinomonadaceae bacterium]